MAKNSPISRAARTVSRNKQNISRPPLRATRKFEQPEGWREIPANSRASKFVINKEVTSRDE